MQQWTGKTLYADTYNKGFLTSLGGSHAYVPPVHVLDY